MGNKIKRNTCSINLLAPGLEHHLNPLLRRYIITYLQPNQIRPEIKSSADSIFRAVCSKSNTKTRFINLLPHSQIDLAFKHIFN